MLHTVTLLTVFVLFIIVTLEYLHIIATVLAHCIFSILVLVFS